MTTNTHRTNVNLTVKKMVVNYLESCCDEKVWDAFYTMYKYDMITYEMWVAFYDKCHTYWYSSEDNCVRDYDNRIVKSWN